MKKELKVIGENLKRRRLILGWDQNDAASKLDMSRVTYGRLEKGGARLTDDLWSRIMDVFELTSDELLSGPVECDYLFFRKNLRLTARERAIIEEVRRNIVRKMRDYVMLDEICGTGGGVAREMLRLRRKDSETIDMFAERVRQFLLGRGWDDNENLPSVLEELGIKLFLDQIRVPKFFGFSFSIGNERGILVNSESMISGERRLFTLAHELGHMLLHDGLDFAGIDEKKNKFLEEEANRFAARLLMPDGQFRSAWHDCRTENWVDRILIVKRRFRVSYKTILYRLAEDMNAHERGVLFSTFPHHYEVRYGSRPRGVNEPQPFPFTRLVSRRMSRLAFEAFLRKEITFSRLAELLEKPLVELREIVNSLDKEEYA